MKKVKGLITCLSVMSFFVLAGCSDEVKDVTPKAVAEKVAVGSVEVPSEVLQDVVVGNVKVVTSENAADLEVELKEALSFESIQNMIDSSFSGESVVESARSLSVEDLSSLMEEYDEKLMKFTEDYVENGRASMSFVKTPGKITGLPEYVDLTIPVILYNITSSTKATQTVSSQKQTTNISLGASVGIDFTKIEDFKDFLFKTAKANFAMNSSSSVDMTIDMSDFDTENPSEMPEMEYSGYIKNFYDFSFGSVFVTEDNVAGKILMSVNLSIDMDDVSALYEHLLYSDSADLDILNEVLKDMLSVAFEIGVYDFEGNKVFDMVNTDNFEEMSEYLDVTSIAQLFSSDEIE